MGYELPHWEGVGRIPPQGGPQADREESLESKGWCMDITPTGGLDGGDRATGGG